MEGAEETEDPPELEQEQQSSVSLSRFDSLERHSSKVTLAGSAVKLMTKGVVLRLAFQSIGVVYGDLGTSPLYVFSSTFPKGIPSDQVRTNVLGVLSLIIYTLTLSPLIKYVFLVLKANDNGEGGTFALYSLLCRSINVGVFGRTPHPDDTAVSKYKLSTVQQGGKLRRWLRRFMEGNRMIQMIMLVVTFLGTCMVIGDGTITPVISVISAVQGIQVQVPSLTQNVIVAISVFILVVLFNIQRFGTDKVGFMFAPAVALWFLFIAGTGFYNIIAHDLGVLRAFNPKYIIDYFMSRKFISLGGAVLSITGTEAMFADLGHFSVRSIQLAFTSFVYPALLLAYCGQAAYLLHHPEDVANTFYRSVPKPVYWPMFVIAVMAAIIASQAMISAVFQIIKQSQAMSCFPRVKVVHTSKRFHGQVYIPEMNWFLMIACVIIAAIFKNTTTLGNAYGVCVVSVMAVTTLFTTIIMLLVWKTNLLLVVGYFLLYTIVELTYFSSVLVKFTEGGWIPMLFAVLFMSIMFTWFYGSSRRQKYELDNKMSADWIGGLLAENNIHRVRGVGLIYTRLSQGIPDMFSHYVSIVPAMHSLQIFVTIKNLPVSNVLPEERFLFRRLGDKSMRMYRCIARYGYRDVHRGDEEFEISLLDSLEEYIRKDAVRVESPRSPQVPPDSVSIAIYPVPAAQQMLEAPVHVQETSEALVDALQSSEAPVDALQSSEAPVDALQSSEAPVDALQSSEAPVDALETLEAPVLEPQPHVVPPPEGEIQEELDFIRQSRQGGVVYVLGHVDVLARRDSNFVTRFLIDYVYASLRKNFRETRLVFEVPHKKLLKIGNLIYI